MPPTFEEYQQQIQQEVSGGGGQRQMAKSVEDMSSAAEDLQLSSQLERQQTQMMLQAMQQQQQTVESLGQNVQQLTQQMRRDQNARGMEIAQQTSIPGAHGQAMVVGAGAPEAPPAPVLKGVDQSVQPPPSQTSSFGGEVQQGASAAMDFATTAGMTAGGFAAGKAAQYGGEVIRGTQAGVRNMLHQGIQRGAEPGRLHADVGLVGGVAGKIGYDPSAASRYTAGAYHRAVNESMGRSAGNWAMGGMQAALGMGTAETLGATLAGEAAMGLPGGALLAGPASSLGGAVGKPFDALNPLAHASGEMTRAQQISAPMIQQSHRFLRGRGGRNMGRFSFSEQADIQQGMRDATFHDLSMSGGQTQQMTQQFLQGGGGIGIQSSQGAVARFEEAFESAKTIMKTFNRSAQEAGQIMAEIQSQGGVGVGGQAGVTQQAFGAANIAGVSGTQAIRTGLQGARQASQAGLMAPTGMELGLGAQATAGTTATRMGQQGQFGLLATVGGQQGIQQQTQQRNLQFLQGFGGTMLAAGGEYGGIGQGLGQVSQNLQTSGDLISFSANRHRRIQEQVDQMGQAGLQAQRFQHVQSIAQEVAPGQNQEEVMRMMMGGGAEAEAQMESFKALPDQIRRQLETESRAASDMRKDMLRERYSLTGRIKHGVRSFVGETLGGNAMADAGLETAGEVGQSVRRMGQEFDEWMTGYERTSFTADEAANLESPDLDLLGTGGGVDEGDVAAAIGGGGRSGSRLRRTLGTGPGMFSGESFNQRQVEAGAAIAQGKQIGDMSGQELAEFRKSLSAEDKRTGKRYAVSAIERLQGDQAAEGARERFGIGDGEESGPMSMDEVAEGLEKRYGGEFNMDEAELTKAHRQKVTQKMISAAQSLFQKVRRKRKERPVEYGPQDVNNEPEAQELVRAYQAAQQSSDSSVQELTKKLMKRFGIRVENGQVHMIGAIEAYEEGKRAAGKYGRGFELITTGSDLEPGANSKAFLAGDREVGPTKEQEMSAAQRQQFGKAAGAAMRSINRAAGDVINVEGGYLGEEGEFDQQELQTDVMALTETMGEKDLKKLAKKGGTHEKFAKLIKGRQDENFGDELYWEAAQKYITDLGRGATPGSGVTSDKGLPEAKPGTEAAKSLTDLNQNLVHTLEEVQKTMQTMRE